MYFRNWLKKLSNLLGFVGPGELFNSQCVSLLSFKLVRIEFQVAVSEITAWSLLTSAGIDL